MAESTTMRWSWSVTSSWIATHPPFGMGSRVTLMTRPSVSLSIRLDILSVACLVRFSSFSCAAESVFSPARIPCVTRCLIITSCGVPGVTSSGGSAYMREYRSLQTTSRRSASNMQNPWAILFNAAVILMFCVVSCDAADARSLNCLEWRIDMAIPIPTKAMARPNATAWLWNLMDCRNGPNGMSIAKAPMTSPKRHCGRFGCNWLWHVTQLCSLAIDG